MRNAFVLFFFSETLHDKESRITSWQRANGIFSEYAQITSQTDCRRFLQFDLSVIKCGFRKSLQALVSRFNAVTSKTQRLLHVHPSDNASHHMR